MEGECCGQTADEVVLIAARPLTRSSTALMVDQRLLPFLRFSKM